MLVRVLIAISGLALVLSARPSLEARDVPARFDDKTFREIVSGFSEAGGRFPSDNFVSNEIHYQTVLPRLTRTIAPGGVYVGVGPDQNFTYIVGLKPRLAFIVDIRRQNLLHHLLYKAVIELSPTREAFLARLFGRPPPRRTADNAPPDAMLEAMAAEPGPDTAAFEQLMKEALDRLEGHRGFALSEPDRDTIRYIYQAFTASGPDISYASSSSFFFAPGSRVMYNPASPYPTYGEIVSRHDGTGVNRSYLGSAANYKLLREMHLRNAIVPLVGDFAGPHALRSLAGYLRDRKATVTTFYTSNVEQYLFQNHLWREFYENVATLPLDATSTFIRSEFMTHPTQVVYQTQLGDRMTSHRPLRASSTLTCSIQELLKAVADARVQSYPEVLQISR